MASGQVIGEPRYAPWEAAHRSVPGDEHLAEGRDDDYYKVSPLEGTNISHEVPNVLQQREYNEWRRHAEADEARRAAPVKELAQPPRPSKRQVENVDRLLQHRTPKSPGWRTPGAQRESAKLSAPTDEAAERRVARMFDYLDITPPGWHQNNPRGTMNLAGRTRHLMNYLKRGSNAQQHLAAKKMVASMRKPLDRDIAQAEELLKLVTQGNKRSTTPQHDDWRVRLRYPSSTAKADSPPGDGGSGPYWDAEKSDVLEGFMKEPAEKRGWFSGGSKRRRKRKTVRRRRKRKTNKRRKGRRKTRRS